MTLARQIIPGSIYLITRRCSERRYFLAPNPAVKQLFGYLLGAQIEAHGLELLAAVQMSNHYHIVVHDVRGKLPDFMRDFHGLIARSVNRLRKRVDAFWDARQPAVTELCDPESVMKMLVYLACNPVEAGLVRDGRDWPGIRTSAFAATERPQRFTRPAGFFCDDSALPPDAALRIVLPPTHKHLNPRDFTAEVHERVRQRELEIAAAFVAEGRVFGRVRDLLRIRWNDAPESDDGRFELSPRVVAVDGTRRIGILSRVRLFVASYRRARAQYCSGMRDTVFPGGTWAVVRFLGLDVHAPPRLADLAQRTNRRTSLLRGPSTTARTVCAHWS